MDSLYSQTEVVLKIPAIESITAYCALQINKFAMYAILDLFKAHFLDLHVFPLPQIILAKFLDVLYVLPKVLLSVKLARLTIL